MGLNINIKIIIQVKYSTLDLPVEQSGVAHLSAAGLPKPSICSATNQMPAYKHSGPVANHIQGHTGEGVREEAKWLSLCPLLDVPASFPVGGVLQVGQSGSVEPSFGVQRNCT